MKAHVKKTLNNIINEIDLKYRTDKALLSDNWFKNNIYSLTIDVWYEYRHQCNIKDVKTSREEFNQLMIDIESYLVNKGYIVKSITENQLYIRK